MAHRCGPKGPNVHVAVPPHDVTYAVTWAFALRVAADHRADVSVGTLQPNHDGSIGQQGHGERGAPAELAGALQGGTAIAPAHAVERLVQRR